MIQVNRPARLLDPGLCLTLRPMSHPRFFDMYRAAIKNTSGSGLPVRVPPG